MVVGDTPMVGDVTQKDLAHYPTPKHILLTTVDTTERIDNVDLDIRLFNVIYTNCRSLGGIFGFSWFEGLVMYSSLVLLGIIKATEKVKK